MLKQLKLDCLCYYTSYVIFFCHILLECWVIAQAVIIIA